MTDIKCKCANCDWTGTQSQTELIADFWSRVEPGETIPHGDCPECGAFCYAVNDEPAPAQLPAPSPDAMALIAVLARMSTPFDKLPPDASESDRDDAIDDYTGDQEAEDAAALWRLIADARKIRTAAPSPDIKLSASRRYLAGQMRKK